jgi:hypothetical protein
MFHRYYLGLQGVVSPRFHPARLAGFGMGLQPHTVCASGGISPFRPVTPDTTHEMMQQGWLDTFGSLPTLASGSSPRYVLSRLERQRTFNLRSL